RLIQAYYSGGAGAGQPIVLAATAPTDVAIVDPSTRMSLGAGYGAATAPHGSHNLAYWSRAFGAWGQYDSNGNAATTDRDLGGFITGVDGALGGGWRAGLATGYTYTGLDADARASSASINSYVLGGYAGGAVGDVALRSGGTWTWHDIDTSRAVIFPGFFESESANYNGDTGQLFAELAYPIFTHGGLVEPFAGLAYVHVGTDGFTESGPIAALTSAGSDTNVGYGTLGARVGSTMVWGGTTLIPHASLAWQYALGDVTPLRTLAFASTGIGMGIGGVPLAQNSALLDIGADVLVGPDATLGLSYMGQYAGDVQDNGLRGRFNWRY
ncbi:MAG: autotransporter outer membrane beta-barrel domain-containing protein, partial [Hyphomicrobium sp.]|nr:autotransporter outer membrane beta-barrel domain-containing protein [Hyphomicrobium sp.]